MIRSSSHPLKFSNKGKRSVLSDVLREYRSLAQDMVDETWSGGHQECLKFNPSCNDLDLGMSTAPSSFTSKHETWLSARMKQACAKQVLAMLKAATEKRRRQLWKLADEQRKGHVADVKKLQSKIDRQPLLKPSAAKINMELDSRFVDFRQENNLFLRISSIGKKLQIRIPIQRTKCSLKWASKGTLKEAVRISDTAVFLVYDVEKPELSGQTTVGADQGLTTVLSLSDGQTTIENAQGHSLTSILKCLARKKKGSKSFRRAQEHRKNYINWSLNRLNFNNIKELRLEDIKGIRYGKTSSRYMSHWCYTLIKDKLVSLSEEKGFSFKEVSNEFRSQRCSKCGWVRKTNRKGKTFRCRSCSFTADADLNAASNLAVDLYEVPFWVRQKKLNRSGFFWMPSGLFSEGQESIVPATDKTCGSKIPSQ